MITAVDTHTNQSGASNEATAQPAAAAYALQFDGTDDYVPLGVASGLGVTNFTIETWVNRSSGGKLMGDWHRGIRNWYIIPTSLPIPSQKVVERK